MRILSSPSTAINEQGSSILLIRAKQTAHDNFQIPSVLLDRHAPIGVLRTLSSFSDATPSIGHWHMTEELMKQGRYQIQVVRLVIEPGTPVLVFILALRLRVSYPIVAICHG